MEWKRLSIDQSIGFFVKQEISLAKAAKLCGLEYEQFIKELDQRDIPAFSVTYKD